MNDLLSDFYTEEQREVITQAQEIINAYSSFNEAIIHIRKRTKYEYNEDAGDFVGISQSPILDLQVDKDEYNIMTKALSYLYNTGYYIHGTFQGKEYIAIRSQLKQVKSSDKPKSRKDIYSIKFKEKYYGEETQLKKYVIGQVAIFTKNNFYIKCNYCEKNTTEDYFLIIDRNIIRNEIKISEVVECCQDCKELFFDCNLNEGGPF